jgi:glycerate dehydrogenase
VDLAAARECGITVSNVRGYCTQSVVQHVFALIFALTTRLCEYRDEVRAGRWQRSRQFCLMDHPIRELAGRTLGIVGFGELGHAVACAAECFGMCVLVAERRGVAAREGRQSFETVLAQSDVLSLHCPLNEHTRGLLGASELALMKPDALLINTARGGIVDEQALADALRAGRLGGAGMDVLGTEPPVSGNPLIALDIPNLIVTPHTAWASREARQRVLDEIAANIHAFRAGTPRNVC